MHGYLITLIELLIVATLVGVAARRWRIPYSTGLVLAGATMGYFDLAPAVAMDPQVILGLMLPILIFGAAIETDAAPLREHIRPVALLSTVGMIVMTAATAVLIHVMLEVTWVQAFLIGTMLSLTDTVSVLAIFRDLRVPKRLAIIIEGESLLNDGTALVLFRLVLAVAVSGTFDAQHAIGEFFLVSLGGIVIGALLGYLASLAIQQTHDHLVEMLLTTALAIGSYVLAEWLGASGVMATVIAGLVVGNYGWRRSLSPTSQVALSSFWELAGFAVNSAVFLLLGLNVDMVGLSDYWPAVILTLFAVHGGRMLIIYGGSLIARPWTRDPLPLAWQHVMVWGNLKGSLTMALALGLPASMPGRGLIVNILFLVVLVSLVSQGLTLGPLVRWLQIHEDPGVRVQFEEAQVRLIAARAAQEELTRLQRAGVLSTSSFERLRARYQVVVARAERALRGLGSVHPEHWDEAMAETRRRLILVEKSAVQMARRERLVSDEICNQYIESLDAASVAVTPINRTVPPAASEG